jgi:repressor LexA
MVNMNENQTQSASEPLVQPLRPTKKQKEILTYIEQFIAEHGYSPSYREIMNGLQYTSVATVALHVGNLIKRGHIRKRDRSARSLEVVMPSTAQPTPLQTNVVSAAEEKWLVAQVERLFSQSESEAFATDQQLIDLSVLLAALRVLGLDGAAQSFVDR